MKKHIPDSFLNQIRSIPIEKVAEQYFPLTKVGSIYQTRCIHEGDRQPSLTFFPQTNSFYCFGCGAGKKPVTEGSSVIDFVMWMDQCSFMEAVQKLADMQGWTIPKEELSEEEKKRIQLLEEAVLMNRQYWQYLYMPEHERYRQYLYGRGILDEDINKWRIGCIPPNVRHPYAGRLVFALMNDWGQTVGFSYRNMSDVFPDIQDPGPKYVNSPQSLIFHKGRIFYGLHFIRRRIREKGYVIIGEGFGDAIIGQKVGLPFTSIMGTSLTDYHIKTLRQYTDQVILWFDGDSGGIQATLRYASSLQEAGMFVKIINVPQKDPDDVLLELVNEKADVDQYIRDHAILVTQFQLTQILERYHSQLNELRLRTAREVLPILKSVSNPEEHRLYLWYISDQIGIDLSFLREMME